MVSIISFPYLSRQSNTSSFPSEASNLQSIVTMGPCRSDRSSRSTRSGRGVNQQCHNISNAELNPTHLDVMYDNAWYVLIYECAS